MSLATQAAVEYGALAIQRAAAALGRQMSRVGDIIGEHPIILVVIVGLAMLYGLRPRARRR